MLIRIEKQISRKVPFNFEFNFEFNFQFNFQFNFHRVAPSAEVSEGGRPDRRERRVGEPLRFLLHVRPGGILILLHGFLVCRSRMLVHISPACIANHFGRK